MSQRELERSTVELAEEYVAGRMSRRVFIQRLLALGLTTSAAGAILAACTSAATASPTTAPTAAPTAASTAAPTAAPSMASFVPATPKPDIKGDVRFYHGPWTEAEDELQQTMIAAFKKLYPNINVTYQFYDWGSSEAQIQTSAEAGAHDVYWLDEWHYILWSPRDDLFADISSYVNDPAWASEKAHFFYWDRVLADGPRLIGVQYSWLPECGLYLNLDMLDKAGYGPDIVNDEAKFTEALIKTTKAPDVYGLLTGFDAWYFYQKCLLCEDTDFLTPDLKAVAVKTPDTIRATKWMYDLFNTSKCAAPMGTYEYGTAPDAFLGQKAAVLSIDCTIGTWLKRRGDEVKFQWAWLPWPGGKVQHCIGDLGFLAMGAKSPAKDATWEMMKFWASGPENAYWCDNSGVYPVRDDAQANGYGTNMPEQSLASFDTFLKINKGPQPFDKWSPCNDACNAEAGRAFAGEITAEQAIDNAEKEVQRIVFG
jgi:ABC-type glycerol-3-phosphate transport system substrate-binding protein